MNDGKIICIDCRMAEMSGIGVYIRNLVPACVMAFPHVSFRLIGNSPLPFPLPGNAVFVRASSGIYSLREQVELPLLVRGTQGLWVPHYAIPLLAPVPLVVTVHDLAHLALPEIFGRLQRCYARILFSGVRVRARALLFNSAFTAQEFQRVVGTPHCLSAVTPLGIAPEWFDPCDVPSPFSFPYFLAVGNLKPHKNLLALCHAFASVADRIPQHLVLVGKKEGFLTGLDGASIEGLVPGRIHCTGLVDSGTLRAVAHHASALVFPSLYEGFGFPPLEALACGTPVIASDIPPVRETCGENVAYIDPHSEDSIRQALLQYAERQTGGSERAAGRKLAAGYLWGKTVALTVPILREAFQLAD